MNTHLQNILDIIQQSEHLNAQEKTDLLKSAKAAEKEFEITSFKLDRTEKVKRTTAILLEETIEELEQKRKAVEDTNRELAIESSLERVRSVAMSMNKADDMLLVCRMISEQLGLLNVKEIRNVQTAIIYETKGTYLNYEYYIKHDKQFITEVDFKNHLIQEKFAHQMLKGAEELLTENLAGDELKEWFDYQKTTNQFVDSFLETASSVNYYWYSLGPVALGMSTYVPLNDAEIILFKRFRNVFELAYRRFLDIIKAIAQAREAQIELALERLRARTMAMQKSDELTDTSYVLFEQLKQLGAKADQLSIGIMKENENIMELSATLHGNRLPLTYRVRLDEPMVVSKGYRAWKAGEKSLVIDLYGDALRQYNDYRNTLSKINFSENDDKHWIVNYAFFSKGALSFSSFEPLPAEMLKILERFAAVFDGTYTRFLDLQNAEAQAREAKIEASLERTRTQSMIMQHSHELDDTLRVFHEQVLVLGINSAFSFLWLPDEEKEKHIFWAAWKESENNATVFKSKAITYPLDRNEPATAQCLIDWKSDERVYSYTVPPAEVKNYFTVWKELIDGVEKLTPKYFTDGLYYVEAFMKYGCFGVMLENDLTADEKKILNRIAVEFERTYTRFLDLQKAEAQAREAQIEAALERVRSRSMAMHHPSELQEVIHTVHKELLNLDISIEGGSFIAVNKDITDELRCWGSGGTANTSKEVHLPRYEKPFCTNLITGIQSGPGFFTEVFTQSEKKEFFSLLFGYHPWSELGNEEKSQILSSPGGYTRSCCVCEHSSIFIINHFGRKFSEAENDILKRFANVFEQTYTRFLDLQKAAAQAREAQIETALEKIRAASMAMHNSEQLGEVIGKVTDQLYTLGFDFETANFVTDFSDSGINLWMSVPGVQHATMIYVPYHDDILFRLIRKTLTEKKDFETLVAGKEEKDAFFNHFYQNTLAKQLPAERKKYVLEQPGLGLTAVFKKFFFFSVIRYRPLFYNEEENAIITRFANVFEQSYTRFLDLQKAEAQAKEAQIETALEKVRSRTLAMQSSEELADTAAVLFRQLIHLGIEPNRLYINIIKDTTGEAEFWITDEDGSKVSAAFESNMNNNPTFKTMFTGWMEKKRSLVIDMKGAELENYFQYLGSMHVHFKEGLTQKRRLQYIAYFNKGFIGMATPDEQPAETVLLMERFAAVFNLTFTRFNDLKKAEAHAHRAVEDLVKLQTEKKRAEDALSELRDTQAQLIQSEKMASLGELTSGIAHEIQNPLNFVNNFSEVSNELMEEMKEELATGNQQQAIELANNIQQNLEKIAHHGKRAESIVKGMLQHSRSSSGQKEPTDINALCDEYLRLAYHGLRAKDKSFNVSFKTDFDESIGRVNIIPQDMGRVILNLITNAFYVVGEKKKSGIEGYEPTVTVSTKKVHEKIEIKVSDNGSGIPQNVIDKIFQPFFTTKPTGQGTGLGLSMSYDIVKAHGGELKVKTAEGKGSEFLIQLPINNA